MPQRLITPPDEEPVTLGEAKNQLRLETGEDDAQVRALIAAARMYVEERCWRGLVLQDWELVLDGFFPPDASELPSWTRQHFRYDQPISLPMGNLADLGEDGPAVLDVSYIDTDGVQRTLSTADYSIDDVTVPGRILPAYGKSWPSTRTQWDAVRVSYTVGWAVADVPEPLKQAIKLAISQMYEKRTPEIGDMPAVMALIGPYRLNRVG